MFELQKTRLHEYIHESIRVLTESKQALINIDFPPVIASLLMQEFGKHGVMIGKWIKDYFGTSPYTHWLDRMDRTMAEYVELYEAGLKGPEEYQKVYEDVEALKLLGLDPKYENQGLNGVMAFLKKSIKQMFFDSYFFQLSSLVSDIRSGKLKDVSPYKRLPFNEARQKYEQKQLFKEQDPIKTYDDGFRWIDVGKRCSLVGDLMKNCGSSGVMGTDPSRTMIVLFDAGGKPHVVVTYSPNEKMISGVEGRGSSAAKSKFHEYVTDLARTLGVKPRVYGEKSDELRIKYAFGDQFRSITKLKSHSSLTDFFKVRTIDGKAWYTDGHSVLTKENMEKAKEAIKQMRKNKEKVASQGWGMLFSQYNDLKQYGVEYLTLWQVAKQLGVKVA